MPSKLKSSNCSPMFAQLQWKAQLIEGRIHTALHEMPLKRERDNFCKATAPPLSANDHLLLAKQKNDGNTTQLIFFHC
jgi:hypothetical protein